MRRKVVDCDICMRPDIGGEYSTEEPPGYITIPLPSGIDYKKPENEYLDICNECCARLVEKLANPKSWDDTSEGYAVRQKMWVMLKTPIVKVKPAVKNKKDK